MDVTMRHYEYMEQTIPEDRRRGDMYGGEVTEVATDDPRWTEARDRYSNAFRKSAAIALIHRSPASRPWQPCWLTPVSMSSKDSCGRKVSLTTRWMTKRATGNAG